MYFISNAGRGVVHGIGGRRRGSSRVAGFDIPHGTSQGLPLRVGGFGPVT